MTANAPGHGRQYVVTTQVTVTVLDDGALLTDDPDTDPVDALRRAVDPGSLFAGVAGVLAQRGTMRVRPAWPGTA